MGVYLECLNESEYRVYQQLEYTGTKPTLPLWVDHVIRKNILNKDDQTADSVPKYIGDVFAYTSPGFMSFIEDTDMQVFAHTSWDYYYNNGTPDNRDGTHVWATGETTAGNDDGETPGFASNKFVRTIVATHTGSWAEKEFTTTAAESIVDFAQYFSTPGNKTGLTRYQLWVKLGGTYYEMPLNGRGLTRNMDLNETDTIVGSGTNATLVNGTKTIDLTAENPNITASMTNGYIELVGRRDGAKGSQWFPISNYNNSTKIVTVTAGANFTTTSGVSWRMHTGVNYGPGALNTRIWDQLGQLNFYRSSNYLQTYDGQNNVEIARHLPPGTYRIRISKIGTTSTDQIMTGRLRIRTMTRTGTPISGRKYFRERAGTNPGIKGFSPPGCYGTSWLSSLEAEIKHNSDSQYGNGPNYGYNRQTGFIFDADGTTVNPTAGQILGPFTELHFVPIDEQCRTSATVSGTAGALVNGTKTINLTTDGPTLTADMVGDYMEILTRTDGLNGSNWFPITAYDNGTKIVTLEANANFTTATGLTWRIHSRYGQFTKDFKFTDQGLRIDITFTALKDSTIARLFTGDYRPSTRGQVNDQDAGAPSPDNWHDYMPEHQLGHHPYACTGIRAKSTRFNVDQGFYPLGVLSNYVTVVGGGPDTRTVAFLESASLDGTGFPSEHKAFFYDSIECNYLRNVQRVVTCEVDPLNWTGSNYYTAGLLSFHSETNKCKNYNTVLSATSLVTNDNVIFGFTLRFMEPAKYTSMLLTTGDGASSSGGGGGSSGLAIKGGNMDTFGPLTLTASPQSLATLTGLPSNVPVKGVILQTSGTINYGNASQPFSLTDGTLMLPVTDLKALKLVGNGVVVNIGVIR